MFFLWIMLGLARAEESGKTEEPDSKEEPDASIVVYGEREIRKQRQNLHNQLRELGYRNGILKDGKTVYEPERSWKPTVVIHDSGLVEIHRTKPRFEPFVAGNKDNKLRYLACIPPFILMCIKMDGWLVGSRKLAHAKAKVLEGTKQTVEKWQTAIQTHAHDYRLNEQLPLELTTLWETGKESEEGPILDMATRRKKILEIWSSRTCTTEGYAARQVVEDFLKYEVQLSEHPVQPQEVTEANTNNPCDGDLNLDKTPSIQ